MNKLKKEKIKNLITLYSSRSPSISVKNVLAMPSPQKKPPSMKIQISFKSNYGNKYYIGIESVKLYSAESPLYITKYSLNSKNVIASSLHKMAFCKRIITLEVFYSGALKEILITNYAGKDKTISAREIMITNEHGEFIYADTLKIGGEIHIEKSNDIYIPIKRIVVNRKKNFFERINSIDLFDSKKKLQSKKIISLSEENKRFLKSKTLSAMPSASATMCNSGKKLTADNYIKCNRIIFSLLENYGHHNEIGLTGLQIYDDNKLMKVTQMKTLGALPKDLKTHYSLDEDERIFENLFNNLNKTNDESSMWLTYYNKSVIPFIELTFKEEIKLNKVTIFNYNNSLNLSKCTKVIEMKVYSDDNLINNFNFLLHIGIGISSSDYSQTFAFPFKQHFPYVNFYEINEISFSHWKETDNYLVPYMPCGFVVEFVFVSNQGNSKVISFSYIKIFDGNGKNLLSSTEYKKICPTKEKEAPSLLYQMKYVNTKCDENCNYENCNKLFFIFQTLIFIGSIEIENEGGSEGIKEIKVKVDDRIVYEGTLEVGNNIIKFK